MTMKKDDYFFKGLCITLLVTICYVFVLNASIQTFSFKDWFNSLWGNSSSQTDPTPNSDSPNDSDSGILIDDDSISPIYISSYQTGESHTPDMYQKKQARNYTTLKNSSSSLKNTSSLYYYFENDSYCYGITKSGQEMFAFIDENGNKLDALAGAGTITVWDQIDNPLNYSSYISNFEPFDDGVAKGLTVYYANSLNNCYTTVTYTFYDFYVKACVNLVNFSTESTVGTAFLQRIYPNSYQNVEKKMNTNWVYPENGDFPYKEFDSYATIHSIDKEHRLYSFYYGEDGNIDQYYELYHNDHLLIKNPQNRLANYSLTCHLVFANTEREKNTDYLSLFKNKGFNTAIGVTPTRNESNNTSLFCQSDTDLNINVSNLGFASTGNLSYTLYDYYGNILLSSSETVALQPNEEYNLVLTTSSLFNKKGIYFLDYSYTDGANTYREYYPFGYIDDKDLTYSNSNPFGLSGIRFGNNEQNDATIYLLDLLGINHARIGISTPEYINADYTLLQTYLQKLKDNGTSIIGQHLLTSSWQYPTSSFAYMKEFRTAVNAVAPYVNGIEIGNEENIIDVYFHSFSTKKASMDSYLSTRYKDGKAYLNSINMPLINAGVALSDSEWLNLMKQYKLLDDSTYLSSHAYSYPHSPDFTKDPTIEHSFESSLVRLQTFIEKNKLNKTLAITEMGYPTTPLSTENTFSGVDLRTQADYTVREYILALSYGAKIVDSYSLYDQVNMFKGVHNENGEYHFGMFYDQDYYGRILPKPYALAYSNMTSLLNTVQSVKEISTSSKTIRAFQVTLADSQFIVMWSNAYPLSNDAVYGNRTPDLPWNNQWQGYESITCTVNSQTTPIYSVDLMGNTVTYSGISDNVVIPVSGSPIYIYNGTIKN